MATRIMLSQYDITGGRQNFAPPADFGVQEWQRVMDKRVLPDQAYVPDARNYDSILFSEWNATVPRPAWAPALNGIKNELFSVMQNRLINGLVVPEGVFYPIHGVSYEQYANNNAAVIPYSVKVDAIDQKPSSGRVVIDGEVDYSTRIVSSTYHNSGSNFVTFGCHVTEIENGPLDMTVELLGGPSAENMGVFNTLTINSPGGYYLDSRQSPMFARLRFTTPNQVRAQVVGIIGIV